MKIELTVTRKEIKRKDREKKRTICITDVLEIKI